MMTRILAAVAAVLLLAPASPAAAASAATDGALDAAKKVTVARIDGRLATLKAEGVAVRAATRLSAGHKSTLEGILAGSTEGLNALRSKVQGETTLAAVKDDTRVMVDGYRVYLLVTPQVRLTIVADVEGSAIAALEDAYATLSSAIEAAQQAGKDVSAAKAQLAVLRTQIDAAAKGLAGVADGLLAVKPGPDAAGIRSAVAGAKAKLLAVRSSIRQAAAVAKATRDLLK
ncbi:hypothetical protein Rhe02_20290 [Rhizocola hellebori]|uniref:Uncharacterized protein n=1 Tax=Rhizocola hellebori TaxID=1392758 RepID=A0A8J3Q5U5_9ACTN|nr:hypothetical protein [Rhizocola hellebori]GIH03962.1 hypothetical protein Rhe02_20290 [Rhizocola hellebori]